MSYIPALEVVRQFYIFKPELGSKDGEEYKKLLFYYPKTDPLDTQIQNVGFCEAVVKFSENFTGDEAAPFHEVNTEKELHVYCSMEKDYLVGGTFSKAAAMERKYFLHSKALKNVISRAYDAFRLFFGTFDNIISSGSTTAEFRVSNLKERLDYFFTRYLSSLKLASVPILDEVEWISYMKLDPTNYLKAQTFVDRTLELFPSIQYALFLYNDRLLLHNLSKTNLPSIYRYLVHNLLPISLRSELQPEYGTKGMEKALTGNPYSHGKFITGITNYVAVPRLTEPNVDSSKSGIIDDSISKSELGIDTLAASGLVTDLATAPGLGADSMSKSGLSTDPMSKSGLGTDPTSRTGSNIRIPSVHLIRPRGEGTAEEGVDLFDEYYLLVYRAMNGTLAMLVPVKESSLLDNDFFRNLDAAIGLQLKNLASSFVDLYGKEKEDTTGIHYIYYNSDSLTLTTTINDHPSQGFPLKLAGVLCEFRTRMMGSDYFGDVVAKSNGDYWIAAKKAGDRELYVVTCNKNATVTSARDEINRLCTTLFEGVFLLE